MWFFILAAFAQAAESPPPLTIEDMQEVAALCPSQEACEGAVARVSLARTGDENEERTYAHRPCAEGICDVAAVASASVGGLLVGYTNREARNPCSASKSDVASRARAFVVRSFGEAGVPIGYLDSSENLILAVGPAPVPQGALKASYQVKIDLSGIPKTASKTTLCSVTAEARRYLLVPPSAWKPGVDPFASKLTSDFYTAFYGQPKP